MVNDEDSNFNKSIFSGANEHQSISFNSMPDYSLENKQPQSLLDTISSLKQKYSEYKNKKEMEVAEQNFSNFIESQKQFIKVLHDYGCKLIVKEKEVDVINYKFSIAGKIIFHDNGDVEVDDNAEKIFRIIANVVIGSNSFEDSLDELLQQGYQPTGELISKKVMYNGQEITVKSGILKNDNGDSKVIYFYKGKLITPDS